MQADDIETLLRPWLDQALNTLALLLDRLATPQWLPYALTTGLLLLAALPLLRLRKPRKPDPHQAAAIRDLLSDLNPHRTVRDRALSPVDALGQPLRPATRPAARRTTPAHQQKPHPRDRLRHTTAVAAPAARGDDPDIAALDTAEAACRKALSAIDPQTAPHDWATVAYDLTMILHDLATLIDGQEGTAKLMEAETVIAKALQLCPRDRHALDWAMLQNGYGNILHALGWRFNSNTRHYFEKAEAAFRAALDVVTEKDLPWDWARIHRNLALAMDAVTYYLEGDDAIQKLKQAEASYRSALRVFNAGETPGDWAYLHYRLAGLLVELAAQTGRADTLKDAELAYRQALKIYTLKHQPLSWGEIQRSLADILHHLGATTPGPEGVKHLKLAADACRQAVKGFAGDDHRMARGYTQLKLAGVLLDLGKRLDGADGLKELRDAEKAGHAALEVITEDDSPQRWNALQRLLAMIKLDQSRRLTGDNAIQALREAERHCLRALSAASRANTPQASVWAWSQTALGLVLYEFGMRLGGHEGLQKLKLAEQAYLRALEVWTEESFPSRHAGIQNLLSLVRAVIAMSPVRT